MSKNQQLSGAIKHKMSVNKRNAEPWNAKIMATGGKTTHNAVGLIK
jgi:hypothetical protein